MQRRVAGLDIEDVVSADFGLATDELRSRDVRGFRRENLDAVAAHAMLLLRFVVLQLRAEVRTVPADDLTQYRVRVNTGTFAFNAARSAKRNLIIIYLKTMSTAMGKI